MKILTLSKRNIHTMPKRPHVRSFAAYLLLKNYYGKLERADIDAIEPEAITPTHKDHWKLRLAFNTNFLRKKLVRLGVLTCVYCGKSNLIIDASNHLVLATADHFVPRSAGGAVFDEKNLVVACSPCNTKKGSKPGFSMDGKHSF